MIRIFVGHLPAEQHILSAQSACLHCEVPFHRNHLLVDLDVSAMLREVINNMRIFLLKEYPTRVRLCDWNRIVGDVVVLDVQKSVGVRPRG